MTFIDRDLAYEAIRQRTEKRCQICKEIKPLAAFSADASRVDGHEYICIACEREKRGVKRPRGRPAGASAMPAARRSERLQTMAEPHLAQFVQSAAAAQGVGISEYLHGLIAEKYSAES